MLEHGGRVLAAARQFGIPPDDWLDLSTGIAPWPYPVPPVPAEVWQRLPEEDDGLEAVARDYYGTAHLLVLPGSQAAIQTLPGLFAPGRVAMPAPLYSEHPAAWQAAGHTRVDWNQPSDYAVLCNPNNPTGQRFSRDALLDHLYHLRHPRLLVVDEAFIDAEPAASLADCGHANIVVLRSLGKFFGLAGARVGFIIAAPALLDRMREMLGPWAVSHPARRAARHALADRAWQAMQRARLIESAARLADLLRTSRLGEATGTALFQYVVTPRAAALHEALARRGILARLFADPPALRFGVPGDENQWQRITAALKEIA